MYRNQKLGMEFKSSNAGGGDDSTTEADLKNVATELKKATDDVKRFAETAQTELKNLGDLTKETKQKCDESLLKMNELAARQTEIEQKFVRRTEDQTPQRKTLGQIVIENEEMKSKLLGVNKRGSVSFEVDTKTILSGSGTWGSTASGTNALVVADRQPLVPMPMRKMTIRDLVAPGTTSSNSVEWAVQTARTNNAGTVAENTQKPYSNYTWDLRNFKVTTIAHMVKASRQILEDAPGLQSTIDAEMEYGVALAEEAQLLNGDGTGANLLGLIPQATTYSAAFTVTDETAIDRLRLAILQSTLALYPVTGMVLNPTDWAKIEMTKDATGRYIIGNPLGGIQPLLWNIPVVESIAMSAGNFLTGAFKFGAQIFDRETINVLISTENVDDFEKNMISIRGEERLSFVVKRPLSFITGSLP